MPVRDAPATATNALEPLLFQAAPTIGSSKFLCEGYPTGPFRLPSVRSRHTVATIEGAEAPRTGPKNTVPEGGRDSERIAPRIHEG